MPAYAPFYGASDVVAVAAERALTARAAVPIPVVLHWSLEAGGDWGGLERLAAKLANHARPWDDLLAT